MRMRAGVVVALGPVVVLSSLAFGDAFERYGASWRAAALPPVGMGSFDIKGDFLPDGRVIAVTGTDVLLERTARSGLFDVVATLDPTEVGATDPSFLRVSPGGASVAIGAGFLKPVVVFDAAAVGGPGAPVVLTSGTLARYYDIGHYDAAWRDATHLAITAGEFGSASYVSLLDTSSSAAAPVNPVIVAGIAGASSGVAFDRDGWLYTANGFDLDPSSGSATGTIRAFDPAEWSSGGVGFEAGGVLIGEVLSGASLLFDAEGNLVVGGGDFGTDSGYLGVLNADAIAEALAGLGPIDPNDPMQLRRLDPLGTGAGYFGAAFDPVSRELFATSGSTWYGTIPAPGSFALVGCCASMTLRRRRHA